MLFALLVLWGLLGCIAVKQKDVALEECKKRTDIISKIRQESHDHHVDKTLAIMVLLAELLTCVENLRQRYYISCEEDSEPRRMKRSELATVVWDSPLRLAEVNCAPQDEKLAPVDLSSLSRPEWVRRLKAPVGRCPTRLIPLDDPNRSWPQTLIGVECACEKSRCTLTGPHRCLTVFVIKIVLIGPFNHLGERLIPVDCLCAAQTTTYIKSFKPQLTY